MIDFKNLQKEYGGKFVAILNEEKVVASGNTFNEIVDKLRSMKSVNKSGLSIRFVRPNEQTQVPKLDGGKEWSEKT